ncbi:MAG: prepilin peptidase [Desulfobacterales bacterium]|nr:MAG: prepilin peptidase [Desulfobacterales bacterium]UCD90074.1 MAG: prepilin peptidase [Desulfobacterales bacterium]
MLNPAIVFIVFLFGLCIGSFLNVCIYRLPASKTISDPPRSVCPSCKQQIRYYDNIPILSYLWLQGQCRHCGTRIPLRYVVVELMTGIVAIGILFHFGLTLEGLIYFVFISSLIVMTFIDIDYRIIPDVITLPGIPIGLIASFALPTVGFKDAIIGMLVGGGSLWMVAWVYYLLTRKDGMGGGDIKLLAMMGTVIGLKGVVFTIFASSAVGTLVGVTLMLVKRKNMKFAVPFGPFLSIGAITYIFFGYEIIRAYFNLLV